MNADWSKQLKIKLLDCSSRRRFFSVVTENAEVVHSLNHGSVLQSCLLHFGVAISLSHITFSLPIFYPSHLTNDDELSGLLRRYTPLAVWGGAINKIINKILTTESEIIRNRLQNVSLKERAAFARFCQAMRLITATGYTMWIWIFAYKIKRLQSAR